MADNIPESNNGQPPFRRYEPSIEAEAYNGNVAPLSPPPLSSGTTPTSAARRNSRRRGNARSRWRQWIQSTPPKTDKPASSTPLAPRSPQSASLPLSARRPSNGNQAINRPSSPTTPSSRKPEPTPHHHPGRNGAAPGRSVPRSAPPESPRSPAVSSSHPKPNNPNSKVTPLRRQPVWSTPEGKPPANGQKPRRKPRRSGRKAPQPVLYGIRLLILGTGIAAIAGTLLSSLRTNPDAGFSATNAANGGETAAANALRQEDTVDLAQPLPLAQELVALETDLVELESMTPGLTQSLFLYDLQTGNYIDLNGSETVAAASTIKVPILVAFLRAVDAGAVRFDDAITLQEDMIAGGSGTLQSQEVGSQYTALEVATEMIINSDNTATNMMIALLGGLDTLNDEFRSWGLDSTVLRNPLPDLDGTNTTSAADLVRVMALVNQGDLLSIASRDRLFSIMQRTYNQTLIPDGLGDETALTYNKTGDIGTALGDVALVDAMNGKRYVVSILVDRPFNDGRASELIRRTAERVHEEMNQPVSPVGSGAPVNETSPEVTSDDAIAPANEPAPLEADPETYVEPGTPLSNPGVPPG